METIQKIAVIGAGTMGPGIAQALATGGYAVSIWDPIAEARERGKDVGSEAGGRDQTESDLRRVPGGERGPSGNDH